MRACESFLLVSALSVAMGAFASPVSAHDSFVDFGYKTPEISYSWSPKTTTAPGGVWNFETAGGVVEGRGSLANGWYAASYAGTRGNALASINTHIWDTIWFDIADGSGEPWAGANEVFIDVTFNYKVLVAGADGYGHWNSGITNGLSVGVNSNDASFNGSYSYAGAVGEFGSGIVSQTKPLRLVRSEDWVGEVIVNNVAAAEALGTETYMLSWFSFDLPEGVSIAGRGLDRQSLTPWIPFDPDDPVSGLDETVFSALIGEVPAPASLSLFALAALGLCQRARSSVS